MPKRVTPVAALGDVHANLPALEAVLEDARAHGATAIWNIGDAVGYGAFPDAVVARLEREGAVSIRGNYDRKVLAYPDHATAWARRKHPEKLFAFRWAHDQLGEEGRKHLASLPPSRRLTWSGRRVLLVHGSLDAEDEGIDDRTDDARVCELADRAEADVVISGHSHRAAVRRSEGVLFVNTGSVGRPDDGDPRAAYALLDLADGRIVVHLRRIAYDIDRAVEAMRSAGFPSSFERMIRRGRKHAWILRHDRAHD